MKRRFKSYPLVTPIFPIMFWKTCRFCKQDFRREKGFKIVDTKRSRSVDEYPYYHSYCCNDCAKDTKGVIQRIKDSIFKPPRNGGMRL